ncbi:hypothetical protein VKT23_019773 [Stygiomarasmius scandens]|uniref:Uncharacterized protein n=1 Tax=Marasmiellus scandens TaxID=2682957 RepID=A0ABR1IKT4_9AGAR
MKFHTLFIPGAFLLAQFLHYVSAQDSLTIYQAVPDYYLEDDSFTSSPVIVAVPVGTADGGIATTYRVEEEDTYVFNDINGVPTSTETIEYSLTIVASAEGWKMTQPAVPGETAGDEVECNTPDEQGNGACIMRQNMPGTTTFEVTQTGRMISVVIPISSANLNAVAPTTSTSTSSGFVTVTSVTSSSTSVATAVSSQSTNTASLQNGSDGSGSGSSAPSSNTGSPSNENGARGIVIDMRILVTILGGIVSGMILC